MSRHAAIASSELSDDPLLEIKDWVLATFDRVRRDTPESRARLSRWQRLVSLRAERVAAAALAAQGYSLPTHRRQQLQRLCQLAPAAVDWLSRHADSANDASLHDFRYHLGRRCDAIIGEQPHPTVNEE